VRGWPARTGRPITPPDQWCRVNLGNGRRTNVRPYGVSSQAETQGCPTVMVRPRSLVDTPTGRHSHTLHAGPQSAMRFRRKRWSGHTTSRFQRRELRPAEPTSMASDQPYLGSIGETPVHRAPSPPLWLSREFLPKGGAYEHWRSRQATAPTAPGSAEDTSLGPAEMSTALSTPPRASSPAPTAKATANPCTTPA
jgi:hypothetical protein